MANADLEEEVAVAAEETGGGRAIAHVQAAVGAREDLFPRHYHCDRRPRRTRRRRYDSTAAAAETVAAAAGEDTEAAARD